MTGTLAPRLVLVHRRTDLDELLARHGTRGQAAFHLDHADLLDRDDSEPARPAPAHPDPARRGRRLADLEADDAAVQAARQQVAAAVPVDWRRGSVERADLARFAFAPGDVVVAVGQDGLVANVAKYLAGQPVIGLDPLPGRGVGALVAPVPRRLGALLVAAAHGDVAVQHRTMVRVATDDGQELTALNEVFVGHASHQTARYRLGAAGRAEAQASSGLIVSSGTGATGWCASAAAERRSRLPLPTPEQHRLAWFVREAWPSPATGTALTEGLLDTDALLLDVESDHLVAFGDGLEADHLDLVRGHRLTLDVSPRTLTLVKP